MELSVLTWNLFHGRAVPPAGRELFDEFAGALERWQWDIALLQEVPPWWPQPFGARLGACAHRVLTSRNALLPLRCAIARRFPDLIKSNGGSCNAILVRGEQAVEHRMRRLSLIPERRWVHAVRLANGIWMANLHLQGNDAQARAAAAAASAWAGDEPVVLGGDFNLSSVALDGFAWAGGRGVDHVLVHGLRALPDFEVLDRGRLSDHAPVLARVAL